MKLDLLIVLHGAGTNLRSFGVHHEGDRNIRLSARLTNAGYSLPVFFVIAVGEVEARDVHPRLQELKHPVDGVYRGAQGTHDLGLANFRHSLPPLCKACLFSESLRYMLERISSVLFCRRSRLPALVPPSRGPGQ